MEKSPISPGILYLQLPIPPSTLALTLLQGMKLCGCIVSAKKGSEFNLSPCPQRIQLMLGKMYGGSNEERPTDDLVLDHPPFGNYMVSFILKSLISSTLIRDLLNFRFKSATGTPCWSFHFVGKVY